MTSMSREVFDRNGEQIVTAVRLLLADPKRRKRRQLVAVYEKNEKRTHELVAEVLRTNFGPVVVYSTHVGTWANEKHRGPGEGVPVHLRQYRKSRSIKPLTGEADQAFSVMSRSNTLYEITGTDLSRIITGDVNPQTFRFPSDDGGKLTFRVNTVVPQIKMPAKFCPCLR